jgi:hypothetical protein
MQFRLIEIACFVAIVANACSLDRLGKGGVEEAHAARALSLGESWAMLHQVGYPQSDYAMRSKFGSPTFKNAVGRASYAAYGGYISCGRRSGQVTGCIYEGR